MTKPVFIVRGGILTVKIGVLIFKHVIRNEKELQRWIHAYS